MYKSTSELGTPLYTGQPAGNVLPTKDVLYREVPLYWVRLLNRQFGALYICQLQADRLSNPTGCCCYAGVGEVQRSNCFAFSHGKLDSSPETTHSWLRVKQLGRVHGSYRHSYLPLEVSKKSILREGEQWYKGVEI